MKYRLTLMAKPTGKLGFPAQSKIVERPHKFTPADIEMYRQDVLLAVATKFDTSKGMQKYIKIEHKLESIKE